MKKLLSVLLSMALALSLLCGAAMAETADVTGEWYGSMFGITVKLVLNEDGTYEMDMMGETNEGTWELDGDKLYTDRGLDNEGMFLYDGEKITAEEEGMELTFTREPVEEFEPAPVVEDAALEDFSGRWKATMISMMGMTLPADAMEMEMILVIDGETASMVSGEAEEDGEEPTVDMPLEYKDGTVTLTEGEDEFATVYTVKLHEDGTLSMSSFMGEELEITIYMELVTEEAEEVDDAA